MNDPVGEPLIELGAQEQVVMLTFDPASLRAHRERFRRGRTPLRFRSTLPETAV